MASSLSYFLSLLFLFSLYTTTSGGDLPPAQDFLPSYGFPKGILPNSVVDYSLSDDGQFVVELASPCYVMFTELVYYDRTLKGKVSYGAVTGVSGVQVKKFFVWISVTGFSVTPDGKYIEFQAGFFSQKLPISMFTEIPDCKNKVSDGHGCHGRRHGDRSAAAAAAVAAA